MGGAVERPAANDSATPLAAYLFDKTGELYYNSFALSRIPPDGGADEARKREQEFGGFGMRGKVCYNIPVGAGNWWWWNTFKYNAPTSFPKTTRSNPR